MFFYLLPPLLRLPLFSPPLPPLSFLSSSLLLSSPLQSRIHCCIFDYCGETLPDHNMRVVPYFWTKHQGNNSSPLLSSLLFSSLLFSSLLFSSLLFSSLLYFILFFANTSIEEDFGYYGARIQALQMHYTHPRYLIF